MRNPMDVRLIESYRDLVSLLAKGLGPSEVGRALTKVDEWGDSTAAAIDDFSRHDPDAGRLFDRAKEMVRDQPHLEAQWRRL